MPLDPVPPSVAIVVDSFARGIYFSLWQALIESHRGVQVTATSYYRSPAENRRVGGDLDSQHQLGLAIDLVYAGEDDRRRAHANMEDWGLVVVQESDHTHVQALRAGVARDAGILRALGLDHGFPFSPLSV